MLIILVMEVNQLTSFSHEDHTLIIASDPGMHEELNVLILDEGV